MDDIINKQAELIVELNKQSNTIYELRRKLIMRKNINFAQWFIVVSVLLIIFFF